MAKQYADVLHEAAEGRSGAACLVSSVASALAAVGAGMPGESPSGDRNPDASLVLSVALAARGVLPAREGGRERP